MTAGTGQPGQDSQDRTPGTGSLCEGKIDLKGTSNKTVDE
jgi:hypothetical protein